ncbi:hypothetical protein HBF26_17365 [Luteibacter jiangsuensis]|uniref:Uncharacterized protein n=1 Tax=Luteibacter jiangsuensis TaxID=637577 RepID=A0ABX0Q7Y0_9GAMM|nr:hypothetical protein [Luteibacter jiangsuensis]NID06668.1 hypothetical protein [Luteibacter jiangsuensis]
MPWLPPGVSLMAFYGNRRGQRARREENERENAWVICPTHGGHNPWQRTLGGWRLGGCQKCAAERYEATIRRWAEEKAKA